MCGRTEAGVAPDVYGLLRLSGEEGGTVETMMGGHGRFYLENMPPGRYRAAVESCGAIAQCALQVPVTQAGVMDLGEVVRAYGGGE